MLRCVFSKFLQIILRSPNSIALIEMSDEPDFSVPRVVGRHVFSVFGHYGRRGCGDALAIVFVSLTWMGDVRMKVRAVGLARLTVSMLIFFELRLRTWRMTLPWCMGNVSGHNIRLRDVCGTPRTFM
jgi:hypothetical protein